MNQETTDVNKRDKPDLELINLEAACVTFVRSREEDDVLRCFGGDITTARQMDLREFVTTYNGEIELYDYSPILLADTIGEWVVTVEENGFEGTRHEVVQQVSHGTQMVSIFWNVNGLSSFIYAVDGEVVTKFELQFPEARQGSDPDRLNVYMADLPRRERNSLTPWLQNGFELAEEITNVRLDQAWSTAKHRAIIVTPLLRELPVNLKSEHTDLARTHPDIATAIRNAPMATLRRIALLAAERAARDTEIEGYPTVRAALDALRNGRPDLASYRANLVLVVQRLERAHRIVSWKFTIGGSGLEQEMTEQESKAFYQSIAGYAVRNALLPDPLFAALQSVYDASLAVYNSDNLFQDVTALANQSFN
jgi:uncharacterized protein DUF6461